MPWGDRTGPNGLGPRSGRGFGFCNGYNVPGYANPVGYGYHLGHGYGRGFGFGRGYGRGYGRGFGWRANPYNDPYYPSVRNYNEEDERSFVENEIKFLKDQLKNYEKRLEDLSKEE